MEVSMSFFKRKKQNVLEDVSSAVKSFLPKEEKLKVDGDIIDELA